MRNLTIRREKSFVASAAKMKVYIEDYEFGDITINDVPCRQIGELANNEEETFVIGNEAARVYVIVDKLSRGYCNDYYPIPEGEEDLYLTGKNRFNPFAGNPFQFDGVTDEEVLENRKKGRNKGIIVMIAALIVGLALGFAGVLLATGGMSAKDFSAEGITISLTKDFEEASNDSFVLCCESPNAAMFALKEEFTLMEGAENLTVEEYAQMVFLNNPLAAGAQLHTEDDIPWFEYSYVNPMDPQQAYHFFVSVFKSDDAFWMIQFAGPEALAEENIPQFIKWSKTVEFS